MAPGKVQKEYWEVVVEKHLEDREAEDAAIRAGREIIRDRLAGLLRECEALVQAGSGTDAFSWAQQWNQFQTYVAAVRARGGV